MTKKNKEEELNTNSTPLDLKAENEKVRTLAKDPSFWQEQWQNIRLIWRLIRDPEVPIYLKLIPFAAVAYLFFPIDFLPDAFLGLGQLDDLTILLLGSKAFTQLVPKHLVERHRQAIYEADGLYLNDDNALNKAIIIDNEP